MKAWPVMIAVAVVGVLATLFILPASETEPIAASQSLEPSQSTSYWTQPNLEPDTCVAAWLLSRMVSPGATIAIREESEHGIPFDVPGTDLQRKPGLAASDIVADRFGLTDPFTQAIVAVARELELSPWTTNSDVFFVQVRGGLAEALNGFESEQECMDAALEFLDGVFHDFALEPRVPHSP